LSSVIKTTSYTKTRSELKSIKYFLTTHSENILFLLKSQENFEYFFPLIRASEDIASKLLGKKKEFRKKPGVAQWGPGGLGSQISLYSACEGDEVVSLTHRPHFH
jgi:hypothetical protein